MLIKINIAIINTIIIQPLQITIITFVFIKQCNNKMNSTMNELHKFILKPINK